MEISEHASLLNVTMLNTLMIIAAVLIHHESLIRLSGWLGRIPHGYSGHFRLIIAVFCILIAHTIEVWLFASAFYFMHHTEGWGELAGNYSGEFLDTVYFSFTTFTTVGYGDIEPLGVLRYLTGLEGLTGLVLITWSASFLFVEMQRYWPTR
ncbi:ion transporter [Marinobacter zhanjiangensis]|uniref:Ion transporter n=1 Tax=Marinobacter zhanjiangensis TaxID=578215 RepID=A0ABQ3B1G0_9GAMM|nr:ion transporter [Marinobacter zhanjiangensis]